MAEKIKQQALSSFLCKSLPLDSEYIDSWIPVLRYVGAMKLTLSYILLLAKQPHKLSVLASLLGHSCHSVAIASSEEQAIAHTLRHPPFLIIMAGDHENWSQTVLRELRNHANSHHITLVALTDSHAPSWIRQEENPGFDGFLVHPISREVLSSLVQSAYTRQTFSIVN